MFDNLIWCDNQSIDTDEKVICLVHLTEGGVLTCPYADNADRLKSGYPCSDYEPSSKKGAGVAMSLSRLAAKCRVCPYVDTCDHKEMGAYGFLPISPQHGSILFQKPSKKDLIRAAKELNTDKLAKLIARELQIPERLLRR